MRGWRLSVGRLAPRSGELSGALAQLELSLEHPEQAFAAMNGRPNWAVTRRR